MRWRVAASGAQSDEQIEQHRVVGLVGFRSDAASRCPTPCAPARPRYRPARPAPPRHSAAARSSCRRPTASSRCGPCRACGGSRANAGSSTPRVSRPRWSNTTVPGSRCSRSAASTIWSAAQMDLHVPAERRDALRQRLDHVDGGGRGLRIELGEADAAHAAVGQPPAARRRSRPDAPPRRRAPAGRAAPARRASPRCRCRRPRAAPPPTRLVPMRCWNSRYSGNARRCGCMRAPGRGGGNRAPS